MVQRWGPSVHSGWLKRAVQTSSLAVKHKVERIQTARTIKPSVFVCALDPGAPCQMHSLSGKINTVKVVLCKVSNSVCVQRCKPSPCCCLNRFLALFHTASRCLLCTYSSMQITNTTERHPCNKLATTSHRLKGCCHPLWSDFLISFRKLYELWGWGASVSDACETKSNPVGFITLCSPVSQLPTAVKQL